MKKGSIPSMQSLRQPFRGQDPLSSPLSPPCLRSSRFVLGFLGIFGIHSHWGHSGRDGAHACLPARTLFHLVQDSANRRQRRRSHRHLAQRWFQKSEEASIRDGLRVDESKPSEQLYKSRLPYCWIVGLFKSIIWPYVCLALNRNLQSRIAPG